MLQIKVAVQIILRSMSRARYDVENVGHFGLGLPIYGHWTSPIRRAADLRGHYNLRLQRDNKFVIKETDAFYEIMDEFCQHISRKERNDDQAERDFGSISFGIGQKDFALIKSRKRGA